MPANTSTDPKRFEFNAGKNIFGETFSEVTGNSGGVKTGSNTGSASLAPVDDQGRLVGSNTTINSNSLAPATTTDFQEPAPTGAPAVDSLDAELKETFNLSPEQQSVQNLIDQTVGLTGGLEGQSEFRTAQEQAQGLPDLLQQQTDLSAQLKGQINRQRSIPLEIQQESAGRARTVGGIAPIQTARLRNNAIQALATSTLLEASRGNLTLAEDRVNQAVSAKYDPIKEQIAANIANLELIMASPRFTQAEKKRAALQASIQASRKAQADRQAEDSTTIMSWATAILANGATPRQAQQLMAIAQSDDPDLEKAFGLYAPFSNNPNEVKKGLLELEEIRANIDQSKASADSSRASAANARANAAKTLQEVAALKDSSSPEAKRSATAGLLNLTQTILNSPELFKITGLKSPGATPIPFFGGTFGGLVGSPEQEVLNQFNQLKAALSLENRVKLKGSGTISDFEARTLEKAASSLDINLSSSAFTKQLKQVRGVFATSSGGNASIKITDPNTGVVLGFVNADQAGINEAIADGLIVEYQ